MPDWNQISFEYPWVLWLIIPWIFLGLVYFFKYSPKTSIPVNRIRYKAFSRTTRQWILLFSRSLPWLSGIALLLALAGPYYSMSRESRSGEGIDIFMAMDISGSMLAKDFEPNRLVVAKNVASSFVARRPFDRIGIAAFAGEAYTLSPLTTDKNILQEFIRQLEVGQLEDGTAIGMGLSTAINRLDSSLSESRIIILLTDGDNTTGYIDPRTAMEIAKQKGIKVYTIGVGSKGEAPMPFALQNNEVVYRMSKVNLNESLLRDIAQTTGGQYFRAQSADELEDIYSEIDALEKSEVQVNVYTRKEPAFEFFALFSLTAILLHLFLNHLIIKSWP